MDARTRPKRVKPRDPPDFIGAAIRFAARTVGWTAVLAVIDLAAPYTGVSLAINAWSVSACALLGVPGLGAILCAGAIF